MPKERLTNMLPILFLFVGLAGFIALVALNATNGVEIQPTLNLGRW